MFYDSLLLNYGGGIIGETSKSQQYSGSAALCIGIGGTGLAALSQLKGKIYSQLHPDNPGEPIPRYDGIQLLAIDSDETDYQRYNGNCRLRKEEFFSVCNKHLDSALKDKGLIKDDPLLNWMEIDKIAERLSPEGAGGVRQIGRYLLMSKVSELDTRVTAKCSTALKARGSQCLDIYIFAGISGGTGSGCFLDVCYIVRQIVKRNGWNAKIMGYFFLPDVVTNKPEVAAKPASVAYNNSNGYAAMKELDYLMSLPSANDRFVQNYGTFQVDTQDPPVDMCHLISAVKADGSMVPNGFAYGINVASDYVMAYLAEVDTQGKGDESGMTMRGHLSNVATGVDKLPRKYGANLSYHVLGACNAEIPMTQINTYLAAGFYDKFIKAINGDTITVTKSVVVDLAKELKLTDLDITKAVIAESPHLTLTPFDRKVLASMPKPAPGYLNEDWARSGNAWLDNCEGKMTANSHGLLQKLENYEYAAINANSLIGRLFRKLWDLCIDPKYGPYYAAQILHNNAYSLISELEGIQKTVEQKIKTNEMYFEDANRHLEICKNDFHNNPKQKHYEAYVQSTGGYFVAVNAVKQQRMTYEVVLQYKTLVQNLYNAFFKPLIDMLNALKESFKENQVYLAINKGEKATAGSYTWQILTLEDIKKRLDESIAKLQPKELIHDFVENLLFNSESWITSDPDKISLLIRRLMLDQFSEETQRSLQAYLFDKYPNATSVTELAEEVENDILGRVHASAIPMFWCDPSFGIQSSDNSFANSSISVPSNASAVCDAADNFKIDHNEYTVRKTGIGDRIFALRLLSGIPLYAYQGVSLLKKDYDSAGATSAGVGSHLYALTERGEDGSGYKDWRNFLPTPMPYSRAKDNKKLVAECEALLQMYESAEQNKVVTEVTPGEYVILRSRDVDPKTYTLADFIEGSRFNMIAYEEEVRRVRELKAGLHQIDNCEKIALKNDGKKELGESVVNRVRRDYFLHYPILQQIVAQELKKIDAIDASLASLEAVLEEHEKYEKDLTKYCNAVFFKFILCENSAENEDYNKIATIYSTYLDQFGDERKFEYSARKDSMKFGKAYPLYQGFVTYRECDAKKKPRADLDRDVADRISQRVLLKDLFVAYDLEKIWTADAIEELEDKLTTESQEDRVAILRFYNGLRRNIINLKQESAEWPNEKTRYEQPAATGATATATAASNEPAPPAATKYVWDPQTQKTLQVYPQYGPQYAYDPTTNAWVNVRADMMVYNGQGWAPLKSDSYFAII